MTFQRGTRAVLAVVVLGLAQFALAANARADKPRFGEFSAWSAPVNIGPTINTPYEESAPAVSPDGRSLYFNRNTNGVDPLQPGKIDEDIFVSRRQNPNKPWGAPQLVKVLNTDTFNERNVALSRDGKLLFFSSDRNAPGDLDLYVSKRVGGHHFSSDEWSVPTNLGPVVNSTVNDIGPGYFEDKHGTDILYFTSNRLGGPGLLDIYASRRGADRPGGTPTFGAPALVAELSSANNDARPAIRADGLEAILQSDRLPSVGFGDVWTSTRQTLSQPWGAPLNLGPVINTTLQDRQAALSDDAETLYFATNRVGRDDIWTSTREPLKGPHCRG